MLRGALKLRRLNVVARPFSDAVAGGVLGFARTPEFYRLLQLDEATLTPYEKKESQRRKERERLGPHYDHAATLRVKQVIKVPGVGPLTRFRSFGLPLEQFVPKRDFDFVHIDAISQLYKKTYLKLKVLEKSRVPENTNPVLPDFVGNLNERQVLVSGIPKNQRLAELYDFIRSLGVTVRNLQVKESVIGEPAVAVVTCSSAEEAKSLRQKGKLRVGENILRFYTKELDERSEHPLNRTLAFVSLDTSLSVREILEEIKPHGNPMFVEFPEEVYSDALPTRAEVERYLKDHDTSKKNIDLIVYSPDGSSQRIVYRRAQRKKTLDSRDANRKKAEASFIEEAKGFLDVSREVRADLGRNVLEFACRESEETPLSTHFRFSHRGFGFVTFATRYEAQRALLYFSVAELRGCRINAVLKKNLPSSLFDMEYLFRLLTKIRKEQGVRFRMLETLAKSQENRFNPVKIYETQLLEKATGYERQPEKDEMHEKAQKFREEMESLFGRQAKALFSAKDYAESRLKEPLPSTEDVGRSFSSRLEEKDIQRFWSDVKEQMSDEARELLKRELERAGVQEDAVGKGLMELIDMVEQRMLGDSHWRSQVLDDWRRAQGRPVGFGDAIDPDEDLDLKDLVDYYLGDPSEERLEAEQKPKAEEAPAEAEEQPTEGSTYFNPFAYKSRRGFSTTRNDSTTQKKIYQEFEKTEGERKGREITNQELNEMLRRALSGEYTDEMRESIFTELLKFDMKKQTSMMSIMTDIDNKPYMTKEVMKEIMEDISLQMPGSEEFSKKYEKQIVRFLDILQSEKTQEILKKRTTIAGAKANLTVLGLPDRVFRFKPKEGDERTLEEYVEELNRNAENEKYVADTNEKGEQLVLRYKSVNAGLDLNWINQLETIMTPQVAAKIMAEMQATNAKTNEDILKIVQKFRHQMNLDDRSKEAFMKSTTRTQAKFILENYLHEDNEALEELVREQAEARLVQRELMRAEFPK
eukprot:TRINITY_DN6509_c0_g1_i1.p1 TRINITY_DN6509_c0_g1~~TRINITY_DN6509_c0_g1_i1.p1  ORF type:complete len:982 (-),score=339.26 TRINITY_DN6509_c0_g1_i1:144-3089(-)